MTGDSPPTWPHGLARRHVLHAGRSSLPPFDLNHGGLHSTASAEPVEADAPSRRVRNSSGMMLVDMEAWKLLPTPVLANPLSAPSSVQPARACEAQSRGAKSDCLDAALSPLSMGLSGCTSDGELVALILSENRRRAKDVESVGAVVAAAAVAAGLVLPPRWSLELIPDRLRMRGQPPAAELCRVSSSAWGPEGKNCGLHLRAQAPIRPQSGLASPPYPSPPPPVSSSVDNKRRPLRSLPISRQPSPPRRAGARAPGLVCRQVVIQITGRCPLSLPAPCRELPPFFPP
jgi:hypothetical protein